MPRLSRRSKRRRAGYDVGHIEHLLHGTYFCPGATGFTKNHQNASGDFTDHAALRKGWNELRHELLPAFIAENPGRRPFAWWLFDAPERRRRVDGVVHPFDDRVRKQVVETYAKQNPNFSATAYALFCGMPSSLITRDDFVAKYETELEYLRRHGLLTDAERKELS